MTTSIPIFPLDTVLYPGGLLPLKIFEQRYLDMTKACVRDATPFGVCRIREGVEVGLPAVPEPVGCTALIEEWEMPHLGVFQLQTRGQHPFRIVHQTTQSDGLIRAGPATAWPKCCRWNWRISRACWRYATTASGWSTCEPTLPEPHDPLAATEAGAEFHAPAPGLLR